MADASSSTDIERAIRRIIRRVAMGSRPLEVSEAVQQLVGAINNQRRLVVLDYLLQLAEEWPEGRGRLVEEIKKIDADLNPGETSETLEEDR